MALLLTTAYFPPIEYFIALAASASQCDFRSGQREVVYIEACENYQKQSYRNRCYFYAADGRQFLNVPVEHSGKAVTEGYGLDSVAHSSPLITQIRIDYSKPWVVQHERAIVSAYRTSAFFEYYQDELFAILDSHPETLWELNWRITEFFIEKVGLPVDLRATEQYARGAQQAENGLPTPSDADFRELIHPKRPCPVAIKKPYFQVFSQKHGFISGLSIMDLLFNEGPNSISFLL